MRPEEDVELEAPLANHDLFVVYVLPGILAHCRWPLNTNLVEGINKKIKVIERMAYGFRETPTSS
jgi:hypothetical protein